MGKAPFAPGFRFSPTDVELVQYYLKRKVMGKSIRFKFIADVDIHKYAPWDLPDKSCWPSGDLKWYFFCPIEKKYPSGARMKRMAECGYWKATGNDRSVMYNGEVVGWIKTLVFHTGRAPKGERTDWVMHEYRLEAKNLASTSVPLDSYVLCMIFQKDGPGPKIGAQYGVPVNEEDWSDDEVQPCANMPESNLILLSNYNSSVTTNTHSPEGRHIGPSESCVSDILPPSCSVLQPVSSSHVTKEKPHVSIGPSESCVSDVLLPSCSVLQPGSSDYATKENPHVDNDDILSMLNCFTEGSTSLMKEKEKYEEFGNVINSGNAGTELGNVIQSGIATAELRNVLHFGNASAELGNACAEFGNAIHSGNAGSELGNFIHSGYATAELGNVIHSGNATAELGNVNVMHSGNATAEFGNFLHSGNASAGNVIRSGNASAELGNIHHSGTASATPYFNRDDIYEHLGDLGTMARMGEDGYNLSSVHNSMCSPGRMVLCDDEQFLELDDLGQLLNCHTLMGQSSFWFDDHLNAYVS